MEEWKRPVDGIEQIRDRSTILYTLHTPLVDSLLLVNMEYDDPREKKETDENEVMTEDSDDELADLEKEFAARKQKLLEERARTKERKRSHVQIERSPSPSPRVEVKEVSPDIETRTKTERIPLTGVAEVDHKREKTALRAAYSAFQRADQRANGSAFASKLYETKTLQQPTINYNERIFEFENVPKPVVLNTTDENNKDHISGHCLSRRYIGEDSLEVIMRHVKILRVSKLLAKVVKPNFEEPLYVNWCFTGIIMNKSEPKMAVNNKKYLSLRVGDFVNTIDVMLFGEAFQKYWKVRLGDVIVILNPVIRRYNGSFNLSLTTDLHNLLELGTLKNYGHCSSMAKLGEQCKQIVDTLRNTLCTYHEESKFKQGSRMELQGSVKPKAPQNRFGEKSEMYFNKTSNKPMFVLYENSGFHQRDMVYNGGEQFDHNKYDRPMESKAAKLRKKKANDNLEKKLLSSVAPRGLENLQKLGIVHKMDNTSKETEKVRKLAFKGTFVQGMGFDPTVQPRDKNNFSGAKTLVSLDELRNLSKNKKISLKPSKEQSREKLMKWKENINFIATQTTEKKQAWTPSQAKRTPTIDLLDSDSDLEIAYPL